MVRAISYAGIMLVLLVAPATAQRDPGIRTLGGGWVLRSTASPLDDKVTHTLLQTSELTTLNRYSRGHLSFALSCTERKVSAALWMGGNLVLGNDVDFAYRVDKRPAKRGHLLVATNHEWLVTAVEPLPGFPDARSLVNDWSAGSSLYIEVRSTGHLVSARFDIAGMGEAIKAFREVCPAFNQRVG